MRSLVIFVPWWFNPHRPSRGLQPARFQDRTRNPRLPFGLCFLRRARRPDATAGRPVRSPAATP